MSGSSQATALFTVIANALALEWAGPDEAAKPLREALAGILLATLERVNTLSRGSAAKAFAKLLGEHLKQAPPEIKVPGGLTREQWAGRGLAQTLLAGLPAQVQSLEKFMAAMREGDAPRPPPAPQEQKPPAAGALAPDWADLLMPPTALAAVWPNPDKLSKHFSKYLKRLLDKAKGDVAADVMSWSAQVPLQAGASYAVANAIQQAFRATDMLGVTNSSMQLGNQVHARLERVAATALARRLDCRLVAENRVYAPGTGTPTNLFTRAELDVAVLKEFSLQTLLNARGSQLPLMVRSVGSTTSREDLVVFFDQTLSLGSSLLASGRPEVYEIKSIGNLVDGVSQVNAYSWNYLVSSVFMRVSHMPPIPFARLDNSLMIPASPERHTLPIPSITVTMVTAAAGSSVVSPVLTAQIIAQLVSDFSSSALSIPPNVVVPFMASGLYGLIPYFVINMDKVNNGVQEALKAILELLLAALAAYLAAKKLMEELQQELEPVLRRAMELLVLLHLAALVIVLLVVAAFEAAAVLAIVAAAALLILVLSPLGDEGSQKPGTRTDENAPITIRTSALELHRLSPAQFAGIASRVQKLMQQFHAQGRLPSGPPAVS
jgi:hypothetical protein